MTASDLPPMLTPSYPYLIHTYILITYLGLFAHYSGVFCSVPNLEVAVATDECL